MITFGRKLKHLRQKNHLTQKELGMAVGFPDSCADVRIAQYESDVRTPKEDLMKLFASTLGVPVELFTVLYHIFTLNQIRKRRRFINCDAFVCLVLYELVIILTVLSISVNLQFCLKLSVNFLHLSFLSRITFSVFTLSIKFNH